MTQSLTRIKAANFRSLANVNVPLGRFSVLVGPNGSGKSNLLNALRFLATMVKYDLSSALEIWHGFEHVQRQDERRARVRIVVEGRITQFSSAGAPDEYELVLEQGAKGVIRREDFWFKRQGGQGRRFKARGNRITISGDEDRSVALASSQTTGLATLPRLADDEGGLGIRSLADFLSSMRILEPDVESARAPSREVGSRLANDGSNLSDALSRLRRIDPDGFALLVDDVRACLPGLEDINLKPVGGSTTSVAVQLRERGVTRPVDLIDASFGTVRMLTLLTALHEPDPPPFTAIEEVDHGLHPYAMDILVDRMRAASERTQILAATHSPTLLNRLNPDEVIVCDRNPVTGASTIPAISEVQVARTMKGSGLRAGELWFSGAIKGIPS